jgi:hypothetical protein
MRLALPLLVGPYSIFAVPWGNRVEIVVVG